MSDEPDPHVAAFAFELQKQMKHAGADAAFDDKLLKRIDTSGEKSKQVALQIYWEELIKSDLSISEVAAAMVSRYAEVTDLDRWQHEAECRLRSVVYNATGETRAAVDEFLARREPSA